jgi:hypothetical protein
VRFRKVPEWMEASYQEKFCVPECCGVGPGSSFTKADLVSIVVFENMDCAS